MRKQRKPRAFWVTFAEDGAYWMHESLKKAKDFAFGMKFSRHKLMEPVKYVREVKRRKK
jgi:hypothetical protein